MLLMHLVESFLLHQQPAADWGLRCGSGSDWDWEWTQVQSQVHSQSQSLEQLLQQYQQHLIRSKDICVHASGV